MNWTKLAFALLSVVLIWLCWRFFKSNPRAFSLQNLNKSFFTMGILALLLIGFIALCVVWLRMG